jgi:hypothetical protein
LTELRAPNLQVDGVDGFIAIGVAVKSRGVVGRQAALPDEEIVSINGAVVVEIRARR